MSQDDIEHNMRTQKVYNDMIDEEINLENPEDVPNEPKEIKNQPVDEVHNVSDDSEGDVPSPRDEDDEDMGGNYLQTNIKIWGRI